MLRVDRILSGKSTSITSSVMRAGLWCLSQPYSVAMQLRNLAYENGLFQSTRAELPVISVGNLTAGGTGKTPAVAYLALWFRARGVRVAILSRGYGALADGRNDEAKELELRLADVPHLQSPDRIASAQIAAQELGMQLVLLDDGFQHRRLKRDLDIVLLDAREPFGHGYLLPRGLLREPIRAIRRAHVVMATRADQVDAQRLADIRTRVQRFNPKAAWVEAEHAPTSLRNSEGEMLPTSWIAGKRVMAFCGIGNPESFFQTLRDQHAIIVDEMIFPDHHPYTATDLQSIERRIENGCDAIVCTGKDLAKIEMTQLGRYPLWSLDVELRIRAGEAILAEYLAPFVNRGE